MTALLIIFALLQLADGWTTYRGLTLGAKELNPVVGWVIKQLGLVPALVIVKVGVTVLAWQLLGVEYGPEIVGGGCILYGVVVWSNMMQLDKMK